MSRQTLNLTPALYDYLLAASSREAEVLRELREETAKLSSAQMQISPEQGQLMALLVRLIGAKRILEVGTYTGYSALAMALALPDDGHILCCDLSKEWTDIARRYWRQAGVDDKVELYLRPAVDTLNVLILNHLESSYDFIFIDADKENYALYYEKCLQLLRPGGLIAVDNVLWNGAVCDPHKQDVDTIAIREFNRLRHGDDRVDLAMVPIGDGLTLLRKR